MLSNWKHFPLLIAEEAVVALAILIAYVQHAATIAVFAVGFTAMAAIVAHFFIQAKDAKRADEKLMNAMRAAVKAELRAQQVDQRVEKLSESVNELSAAKGEPVLTDLSHRSATLANEIFRMMRYFTPPAEVQQMSSKDRAWWWWNNGQRRERNIVSRFETQFFDPVRMLRNDLLRQGIRDETLDSLVENNRPDSLDDVRGIAHRLVIIAAQICLLTGES